MTQIYYFDKEGKACKKDDAVRCIIGETDTRGNLIQETFADIAPSG